MPHQSLVSAFFTRKEGVQHGRCYVCNLCGKTVTTSEATKSNLNRHMKKAHPQQELTPSRSGQPAGQASLDRFAAASSVRPMPRDSKEYKTISKALARFVASSYVPLALVENEEFKAFVASLNPSFPLPTRVTLRKQLLDTARVAQDQLKQAIKDLPADATVALTMDLWSNRQLLSFLGMTIHMVSEQYGLQTHLLCFRRFPERHTADNIADGYERVIGDYGLQGRVSLLVTDSAANMQKAFRVAFSVPPVEEREADEVEDQDDDDDDDELEATRLDEIEGLDGVDQSLLPRRVSCGAHTLQLVVKDALRASGSSHSSISKALGRLNAFIGATRRSTLAMEILSKAGVNLAAPNATRWNSQFKAVESFLRLPASVMDDLRQVETLRGKVPSDGDRLILREVAEILEPFSVATDVLQGDRVVTSSHLIPTIMGLRSVLVGGSLRPTTTAARQLREALVKSLSTRFAEAEKDPAFLTATILDPRFKALPWSSSEEQAKEVEEACRHFIEAEFAKRPYVGQSTRTAEVPAPGPSTAPHRPSDSELVDLASSDDDEPMPSTSSGGGPSPSPSTTSTSAERRWGNKATLYSFMQQPQRDRDEDKTVVHRELDGYLREAALPQDVDPLGYWAARTAVYPHLAVAARNVLCIPASSGPSERIFSISGRLYSPVRSRLKGDIAEALMHVRCSCSV